MTRVDFPEPETPVTAVSAPSGRSSETSLRLCRETPPRCSQPVRRVAGRARPSRPGRRGGRWSATRRRARAPRSGRSRAPARHPRPAPGPMSTTQSARRTTSMSCSTTNSVLPAALSWSSTAEQRLGVGGVQPGRRLVQHVDDTEQARAQLGGDPQPLGLPGRERRRAAAQREVAQAESQQHVDARDQVAGDPARRRRRSSPRRPRTARSSSASSVNGSALTSAIDAPAKVTASASRRSPLPWQVSQGALCTKRSIFSRIASLGEPASTLCTWLRALRKVPM